MQQGVWKMYEYVQLSTINIVSYNQDRYDCYRRSLVHACLDEPIPSGICEPNELFTEQAIDAFIADDNNGNNYYPSYKIDDKAGILFHFKKNPKIYFFDHSMADRMGSIYYLTNVSYLVNDKYVRDEDVVNYGFGDTIFQDGMSASSVKNYVRMNYMLDLPDTSSMIDLMRTSQYPV